MVDEETIRKKAKSDGVTLIATGIAVVEEGKILVVWRAAHDDTLASEWELPGGGVNASETIEQGAIRELREETGLEVEKVLGTFEGFDYVTSKKPKVRQVNFKVTVKPGKVQLTEHDMHRRIAKDDIPELQINPSCKIAYTELLCNVSPNC